MLGLFVYLVSLAVIIFASLSVSILCSVKVLQPPGLFDVDLSTGSLARKRFIVCIGSACILRCLFSSLEFIVFAINVVKENKPTSSISYYSGFDHTSTSRLVFACRVLPTLLFLGYYGIIGDYFASLFYSIRESSYYAFRMLYFGLAASATLVILFFLLVMPDPQVLNLVCLVVVIFLSCWIVRHTFGINKFYTNNEDVLLESSNIDQGRLLARMQRVVVVALVALLSCAVVYCADMYYLLPRIHFYARSIVDLSVILLSEVGCAWILVSLLSNRLTDVEGKLQMFCGTHALRLLSAHTSGASTGSSGAGTLDMAPLSHSAPVVAGMTAAAGSRRSEPVDAAQRQEMQLLQQQKLLRRYGNYESIPLGDLAVP